MRRGWGVVKNLLNIVKAYGTSFLELEPEPAKKKTEPVPVKNRPTPQNWWRKEFWAQGRKKFHMPGADQERTAAPSNSVTTILYLGHFVEGNSGLKGRTLQSYSIAHHVSHWRLRPGSFSTDSVELKLFSSDAAVHSYFGSGPKLRSRKTFFLYSVHTGRKLSTAHKVQIPGTV